MPSTSNSTTLMSAIALALGVSALPAPASAAIVTFEWSGGMTMLDPAGAALADSSVAKGANPYFTPLTGVLEWDTATGTGSGYSYNFWFFSNPQPVVITNLQMEAVGDGAGGPGSLVLGNGGFYFGGAWDIPFSIVWDAAGLLSALPSSRAVGSTISGVGVRPASDGTYVGSGNYPGNTSGYLDLGLIPLATTKWNTTPLCTPGGGNAGDCIGLSRTGDLPLIADTATNTHDYDALFWGGNGLTEDGIGGSPFLAGPFEQYSLNLNITSLTVSNVSTVPLPAAVWLLGSGLVGLIGVARGARRAASGNSAWCRPLRDSGAGQSTPRG